MTCFLHHCCTLYFEHEIATHFVNCNITFTGTIWYIITTPLSIFSIVLLNGVWQTISLAGRFRYVLSLDCFVITRSRTYLLVELTWVATGLMEKELYHYHCTDLQTPLKIPILQSSTQINFLSLSIQQLSTLSLVSICKGGKKSHHRHAVAIRSHQALRVIFRQLSPKFHQICN